MANWNDNVISEFHEGKHRVADMFDLEALLLLHTTGAKSGQERVNPLAYLTIDDSAYIVASAAGAPKHPDWYANVVKNPEVSIEWWKSGNLETTSMTAEVVAEGADRDRLWDRVVRMAPGFGDYQTKTTRVIPLIRLQPRN